MIKIRHDSINDGMRCLMRNDILRVTSVNCLTTCCKVEQLNASRISFVKSICPFPGARYNEKLCAWKSPLHPAAESIRFFKHIDGFVDATKGRYLHKCR